MFFLDLFFSMKPVINHYQSLKILSFKYERHKSRLTFITKCHIGLNSLLFGHVQLFQKALKTKVARRQTDLSLLASILVVCTNFAKRFYILLVWSTKTTALPFKKHHPARLSIPTASGVLIFLIVLEQHFRLLV